MKQKTIKIAGAGISGLTAAIYYSHLPFAKIILRKHIKDPRNL